MDGLYERVKSHKVVLFRELMVNYYKAGDTVMEQKEFLLQDPNGYLLRFTN